MKQVVGRCKDARGDDMLVNFDDIRLVRKPLSTETAKANAIIVFKNGDSIGTRDTVDDFYKFWDWAVRQ